MQRVSPEKKIPAEAGSKKKNSCNLKIPLPTHHFSNGPSLNTMNGAGWRLAAERTQDRKCLLDPLFGQEVAFMCFIVEDVAENSIGIHVSILV